MKRRDSGNERSEAGGLRAQLSRAVEGSLGAIKSALAPAPKTVDVSKQRLSDVLWNDRTLRRTHDEATALAEKESRVATPAEQVGVSEATEAEPPRTSKGPPPLPRKRIDTPKKATAVRARLENAKARVSTRLGSMPKGIAPLEGEDAEAVEIQPEDLESAETKSEQMRSIEAQLSHTESPAWLAPEPAKNKDAMLDELTPPKPAPPPAAADDEDDGGEEPIRTRSMARLLAGQGHRTRALKIYDALLAADSSDEALRAEAEALRRAG